MKNGCIYTSTSPYAFKEWCLITNKRLHVHLHAEDQPILLQQYRVFVRERGRSLDKFCGSVLLHEENAEFERYFRRMSHMENALQWFREIYHERWNVKLTFCNDERLSKRVPAASILYKNERSTFL
jgi:hypothetical protein